MTIPSKRYLKGIMLNTVKASKMQNLNPWIDELATNHKVLVNGYQFKSIDNTDNTLIWCYHPKFKLVCFHYSQIDSIFIFND